MLARWDAFATNFEYVNIEICSFTQGWVGGWLGGGVLRGGGVPPQCYVRRHNKPVVSKIRSSLLTIGGCREIKVSLNGKLG